jgi:outer membrane protein assembly factor BamB
VAAGEDTAAVAWGRAASPLIVDDLVIVPAGGPKGGPHVSLIAFDKHSGDEIWRGGDQQISYSSPVLATMLGVRQILIVNENSASGHDVTTGRELWSYPWPGGSSTNASVSQAVAIDDNGVLLSKGYGGGAEMLRLSHDERGLWYIVSEWKNPRVLKTKFTNVAVRDNYGYGLSDGILECVDLQNGKSQWKRGRYEHGQILLVGNVLLVLTETGELVMVDGTPDGHHELGRLQALTGKTWNTLCLYGNHLLIRNGEEAACYQLTLR